MYWFAAAVALTGCSFTHGQQSDAQGGKGDVGDAGGDAIGSAGQGFVVLHVPAASAGVGSAAVTFTASHVIDTDALSIDGGLPAGVTFDHVVQDPSGAELAVLHVSTFDANGGAMVRVIGGRPLVVIAAAGIVIAGTIDAGALGNQRGAGGGASAAGDRPGMLGAHVDTYLDGGGGGGGRATLGAAGGDATNGGLTIAVGGSGGGVADDPQITVLAGGSGGGFGRGGASGTVMACRPMAGAGGGALQLSSPMTIQITGTVNAGGGGGGGGIGIDDVNCFNRGSGSGGGSGGSIVLQAPAITVGGGAVVSANGGGGGGGATAGTNGGNGGNGMASAGAAGASPGGYGSSGGVGGSNAAPTAGQSHTTGDGNGGGGGGAAGRIAVYRTVTGSATLSGTISPTAYAGTY